MKLSNRIEKLENTVKNLEESMNMLLTCSIVIKRITEKVSGIDIDKEMQEELKNTKEDESKMPNPQEATERPEVNLSNEVKKGGKIPEKIKKGIVDKQTIFKESFGYYKFHNDRLLKEGYKIVKDTKKYTVYEKTDEK